MKKYDEIANYIIDNIKNKTFESNAKIPSESEISKKFNVSRMTVRKAIDVCANRGYIYTIKGKGSFVTDNKSKFEIDLNDISGFTKRFESLGMSTKSEIISLTTKQPSELLREMFHKDVDKLLYFQRVRYVDDKPLAVEHSYIDEKYMSDITINDVIHSFDEFVMSKGLKIHKIKKEMVAVIPDNVIKGILKIESVTPVIKINYLKYLETSTLFSYSKVFYNQDLFKFVQTLDCYSESI